MNKNQFAPTPPMGWNSYDYYDTAVTEEQVKANAGFMAAYLKEYGWEYIVVDIQWYARGAGSRRESWQYIPFGEVVTDEYSRLLPCPERFPSAEGGKGFGPLADYVHSLGLKFGIHIMRGIPRIAAHLHTPLLGTDKTADEIADPSSTCFWNPDMYGVRPDAPGAQEYYDSLMALYAGWGVDFIKCDDICRQDAASARAETEMLHRAILKTGRPIVLSLSPGPARIDQAWMYEKTANMWRITDDFWDDWALLKDMFARCELWQNHVSEGCWPDCDMLPLGKIGGGFGAERTTRLTPDEQVTMMTLWCVFRSPLMLGAELTRLDADTLRLLRNRDVLRLVSHSAGARQIVRNDSLAAWISRDTENGAQYFALFNLSDEAGTVRVPAEDLADAGVLPEEWEGKTARELWTGEEIPAPSVLAGIEIPAHGAKLCRVC